jgi:hypothetical protein
MTETQIETLLRKAPRPAAPTGLQQRLLNDIPRLPRRVTLQRATETASFWRRWFPALSFGVLLLGCLIALAVQTSQMIELQHEQEALRAAAMNLEQLRQENAELQSLSAKSIELERTRQEQAELEALRAEVAPLRERAQEIVALRAENQRLAAERAAQVAQAGIAAEEDPFAQQKAKAESIACVSNMKQIGLGARIWANDHNDVLPPDVVSMKNALNTPRVLTCPSDKARTAIRQWEQFDGASVSYEFHAPQHERDRRPFPGDVPLSCARPCGSPGRQRASA